LVDQESSTGASHDVGPEKDRGIRLSDIAILARASTDVRTYLEVLEEYGIPAIVRAGPDLFQRPEVLLLLCALCHAAGIESFYGGIPPTMASIAAQQLATTPEPVPMVRAAAQILGDGGVPVTSEDLERLLLAAEEMRKRLQGVPENPPVIGTLTCGALKAWLRSRNQLRRVYPQTLFQWLAAEVGIAGWDAAKTPRTITAMFHLGQLASLITGIETPGWVTPADLKWQLIAVTNWGSSNARSEEAPLLVAPNAVSILTIHAAKGLEFPVVFLADVAARRFPSQRARTAPALPFTGLAAAAIDPASLADDANYDGERRLMYVGLTRAERFLFVSSASTHQSLFERELRPLVARIGGELDPSSDPAIPDHLPTESEPTSRLVTSFSDLRYYLECPHDYYLRKVLGFAPTIDQAFGYGRGVHNLMRDIHLRPRDFAEIADDESKLKTEAQRMIDEGLFYLRYTTGEPLENMKRRAIEIVSEYVQAYHPELATLEFEPERAFETLIEEADVLVSGAIDVIRHDDPPRVALIDFKSGDPAKENENVSSLDEEQMRLQVSLYGLAAKKELEYEPDLGLVRYLGVRNGSEERRELVVPLDSAAMEHARETVVRVARDIQGRQWDVGPQRPPKKSGNSVRCEECDFLQLCGRPEAFAVRALAV
jgi:DNA helicase-2/ATP-dependent DNA helicase PcrA